MVSCFVWVAQRKIDTWKQHKMVQFLETLVAFEILSFFSTTTTTTTIPVGSTYTYTFTMSGVGVTIKFEKTSSPGLQMTSTLTGNTTDIFDDTDRCGDRPLQFFQVVAQNIPFQNIWLSDLL